MFFHFYKNIKNMHKNIKLQYLFKYRSTVNTNQIKSIILLQNTRSVQEIESLVHFAHEKYL